MDKAARIVAAALFAASISYATPALSVQTTAEQFLRGLSSDLAIGDVTGAQTKLSGLQSLGFEGVLVDDTIVYIARMLDLLAQIQSGNLNAAQVAASLNELMAIATHFRFIVGDIRVGSVDLGDDSGTVFPAGSAA